MPTKDTASKQFMRDNINFAQAFNSYFFGGDPVINPDTLTEVDVVELLNINNSAASKSFSLEKVRDVLKKSVVKKENDGSCFFAMLGVENQSDVNYAMPVRSMLYDALNYYNQTVAIAKSRQNSKALRSGSEFLSGLKATDMLAPVVTLVVYWGEKPWSAPRTLKELLMPVGEPIMSIVEDYKLNLIVPREIQSLDAYKGNELGKALRAIAASSDKNAFRTLVSGREFSKVGISTVEVINAFTNANIRISEKEKEEGKVNMCKAIEELQNEARAEGKAEGEAELTERLARNLQREDGKLSFADAMERAKRLLSIAL